MGEGGWSEYACHCPMMDMISLESEGGPGPKQSVMNSPGLPPLAKNHRSIIQNLKKIQYRMAKSNRRRENTGHLELAAAAVWEKKAGRYGTGSTFGTLSWMS